MQSAQFFREINFKLDLIPALSRKVDVISRLWDYIAALQVELSNIITWLSMWRGNGDLVHFVSECEELSELRKECFGRVLGSECWLKERMAERNGYAIKQLCKFLRLGDKHRESCLRS